MPRALRGKRTIPLAMVLLAMLLPSAAPAAQVVNGDFESGTLAGWEVRRALQAGNWFAYKGTEAPLEKQRADQVQPPPQGNFAAVSDEVNPDTLLLFQDLRLEPGTDYNLSLLAYYDSYAALAIPSPDTLSADEEVIGGQANQQFRIDLVRPEAPVDSIGPDDVLLNVFRTRPGADQATGPRRLTADLSRFAGQTVRLRIAVAVTEEVLNAGVDAISLSRRDGSFPSSPQEGIRLGKPKANRKNGIVTLPVWVPGAGLLKAESLNRKFRRTSLKPGQAGKVMLRLKPSGKGRQALTRRHRLQAKAVLIWRPLTGGEETVRRSLVFKLRKP